MTDHALSQTTRAAVDAFQRGWCPVPLRPGQKRPAISSWTALEYESADHVRDLFQREQSGHGEALNVGLILGEPGGGLVDVDLDHPKASRLASFILPPTPMRSGRPARPYSHHWYVCSEDTPEGTKKYQLPDGSTLLELRSSGGQTVIPPSLHPDGEEYLWHGDPWGGLNGPRSVTGPQIRARVATLAMAATLLDAWPKQGGRHDAYLALAGGLLRYGGVDGETGAVHPLWRAALPDFIRTLAEATSDDDGPDTRAGEVMGSTLKRLESGGRVQGFPTLAKHIGEDHTALVREIAREIEGVLGFAQRPSLQPSTAALTAEQPSPRVEARESPDDRLERLSALPMEDRDPLAERINAWDAVDLEPYLVAKTVGPQPGVLFREDGVGLMYEGKLNSVFGESESAKSWLVLKAVVNAIHEGKHALVIDCEDGPHLLIERLRDLGADAAAVRDRLTYHNPDAPISALMIDRFGHPASSSDGDANQQALQYVLDLAQPKLIVVDGLTQLYNMHALNPNDTAHTARAMGWLKGLTHDGTRTVIMIDHTSKNTSSGGLPTGSQHKVAMVQGTALHARSMTKPRRGHLGHIEIYVSKDRVGHVRAHLEGEKLPIADMWVDGRIEGRVSLTLSVPDRSQVTVDGSKQPKPRKKAAARTSSDTRVKPEPEPKRPRGRPVENHLPRDCSLVREAMTAKGPIRFGEIQMAMPERVPPARLREALARMIHDERVRITGTGPQTRYELTR